MIGVLREIGREHEVSGSVTVCGVCCAMWRCQSAAPLLVDSAGYGGWRISLPRRQIEIIGEMATWPILPILRTMFSVENLRAGRGQRGRLSCFSRGLARRSGWSRVSTCPQGQIKTVRISNESGRCDVRRDIIALQRGHDVGKARSIRNATTPPDQGVV
jgi:hypothetical protein